MPIPSTGAISLATIQTEYGGSNPISINEYYRGGATGFVKGDLGSTRIPTSGQVSFDDYRGTRQWNLYYVSAGNTISSQVRGVKAGGGGNAAWSMGYCYGPTGPQYDEYNNYIGPGTTTFFAPNSGFFTTSGVRVVNSGNLSGNWYPMIPTLAGKNSIGQYVTSIYASGTDGIDGYSIPTGGGLSTGVFAWRHPLSNWTDSMITGLLGFSSYQNQFVNYGTRVWWRYFASGMDQTVATGFMIFKASTYNSSGAQTCYNNHTKRYMFGAFDSGGEWGEAIWKFEPTVNGTTVTNVGGQLVPLYDEYNNLYYGYSLTAFSGVGGRASVYAMGAAGNAYDNSQSDYTVIIGTDDLVVPMLVSDTGFSGFWPTGGYGTMRAAFGYIGAF